MSWLEIGTESGARCAFEVVASRSESCCGVLRALESEECGVAGLDWQLTSDKLEYRSAQVDN